MIGLGKFWKSWRSHYGPIGVAIDGATVRMAQVCDHNQRLLTASAEIVRGDLTSALTRARHAESFYGNQVVMCVGADKLELRNVRVPLGQSDQMEKRVSDEVISRLPEEAASSVIHYVEVGAVHHAEKKRMEVVAVACQPALIQQAVETAERARLNPVAIDVEPGAIQRAYLAMERREKARGNATALLHVGAESSCLVLLSGEQVRLAKSLSCGGDALNEAVAVAMELDPAEAARLRNRVSVRTALRDESIGRDSVGRDSVGHESAEQEFAPPTPGCSTASSEIQNACREAIRNTVEQLAHEIALCSRYYSVTFRARAPKQMLLMGSEANPLLAEMLTLQTGVACRCASPTQHYQSNAPQVRESQWALALGLSLQGMDDRIAAVNGGRAT